MAKKKLKHRMKRITKNQITKKHLRSGSKEVKRILLIQDAHCDICGKSCDNLQLHHKYYIRFGFSTRSDRCCLLCNRCHKLLHEKTDNYVNRLFSQNPNTDFNAVYEQIKRQLQTQLHIPPWNIGGITLHFF